MSLKDKIKIIDRKLISDSRGWFLKVITGKECNLPNFTGEVYLISAEIGECRANHYHIDAHEWFTLVRGKAEMIIEDIITKERIILLLDAKNPHTIYVPNNIAHAFNNVGSIPYLLVTYTSRLYEKKDTVSYNLFGAKY
ncbi:MAG: WxcM-like domain-containing protein [Ignavibacteriaceae bacterium]